MTRKEAREELITFIGTLQNMMQLAMVRKDTGARDNAYEEFVKSLKQTDREFVKRILEEFE